MSTETPNAQTVINSLTSGDVSGGKMSAIRNVSDLLHGHMTAEEFDKITELVSNARSLPNMSDKRKEFNVSYLKAIEGLTALS